MPRPGTFGHSKCRVPIENWLGLNNFEHLIVTWNCIKSYCWVPTAGRSVTNDPKFCDRLRMVVVSLVTVRKTMGS